MIVRIRPFLDIAKVSGALAPANKADAQSINEFEKTFASYLGVPYAVAVHQGRSALLLALKILDIKQGDEVIVQSHIFYVVIDAILEAGGRPVLVDSSLDDFNISAEAIKSEITPRTKAIIVTHLGLPCDMEAISGIAREHNCFLIENCAHTLGARYDGKSVGTFGDVSFCSFDVDKPLSTGDGGMLIINNNNLIDKAEKILKRYKKIPLEKENEIICGLLLQHFVTSEGIYPEKGFLPVDFGKNVVRKDHRLLSLVEKAARTGAIEGFIKHVFPYLKQKNYLHPKKKSLLGNIASRVYGRAIVTLGIVTIPKIDSDALLMNSMRSTVGIECLRDFDTARDVRNRNTQYYIDYLDKSAFKHPKMDERKKPAFIRYTVMNNTKHDNSYISGLAREHGFELGIFNWSTPIHLCYPYSKILSFDRDRLRNSEYLAKRLLSLPVHPYVDEGAVKKIAGFLNDFVPSRP